MNILGELFRSTTERSRLLSRMRNVDTFISLMGSGLSWSTGIVSQAGSDIVYIQLRLRRPHLILVVAWLGHSRSHVQVAKSVPHSLCVCRRHQESKHWIQTKRLMDSSDWNLYSFFTDCMRKTPQMGELYSLLIFQRHYLLPSNGLRIYSNMCFLHQCRYEC
jgi:hypothetical protein